MVANLAARPAVRTGVALLGVRQYGYEGKSAGIMH